MLYKLLTICCYPPVIHSHSIGAGVRIGLETQGEKMQRIAKVGAAIGMCLITVSVIASVPTRVVPELDGSVALLALALTAAIVAIVKEKRRRRD